MPAATFSRVERGRTPDLATFRKLVEWLGIPAAEFFTPTQRPENTPQAIAEHLRTDPALTEDAATKIAEIVTTMYENLAKHETQITVHLRAAKTFTPTALQMLTGLLDDMQTALEARAAE